MHINQIEKADDNLAYNKRILNETRHTNFTLAEFKSVIGEFRNFLFEGEEIKYQKEMAKNIMHIPIINDNHFIKVQEETLEKIFELYCEKGDIKFENDVATIINEVRRFINGKDKIEYSKLLCKAYFLQGTINFYRNERCVDDALFEKSYRYALKTNDSNIIAIVLWGWGSYIGDTNKRHNRHELALSKFKKSLKFARKKDNKILQLIKDDISMAYIMKGIEIAENNFKKAIIYFNESIKYAPTSFFPWSYKGLFSIVYKHDYSKGLKFIKIAIKKDTNSISLHTHLCGMAFTFIELKKNEEAWVCIIKSLKLKPDNAFALFLAGKVLTASHKYKQAIEYFDKALNIKRQTFSIWNYKGVCYLDWNKNKKARYCFEKAIETAQDSINVSTALHNKGASLCCLNDYKGALLCFNEALNVKSDDPLTWHDKGFCLKMLKKYSEAKECYEKAIKQDPNNFDWLESLLELYTEMGRVDDAIYHCLGFITKNPKVSKAWFNLARLYSMKNDDKRFVYYTQYYKMIKRYDMVWFIKAHICAKNNKLKPFLQCIEKSLQYNPSNIIKILNQIQNIKKDGEINNFRKDPQFIKLLALYSKVNGYKTTPVGPT
jgi:tetratricopeptide (TPR) repeat protein